MLFGLGVINVTIIKRYYFVKKYITKKLNPSGLVLVIKRINIYTYQIIIRMRI